MILGELRREMAAFINPTIYVFRRARGIIETDFNRQTFKDSPIIEFTASQTALGRTDVPEDIGGIVAFLCTEAARSIEAQRIEASSGRFIKEDFFKAAKASERENNMNDNTNNKKVWFVTGASKGLGLTLAKKLLREGCRVAATSRNEKALIEAFGGKSDNFLPLEMDLLGEQSVSAAINKTIDAFSEINVVVNNAGYGQTGTLEELSDREVRRNFDVNVFGVLNVIRNVMPHLRARRSGHIFNVSSIGGYTANFAGWGSYCATKFAVAALTESLAAEAKAFGIKATIVYPGYFRTDFLSKDSIELPENPIAEYQAARESEDFHKSEMNGNQPGDPEKLADVLIKVAAEKNPPLHLFLGQDAYNAAEAKTSAVQKDMKEWLELATATDFEVQIVSAGTKK